ncbi:DUF1778 domain-containing protein [Methylobacterium indicum]|uniref:DUF1778 domain-containing protein n=1 Tax=Methylobacterium indicum TaxID=1775910 RepID=A0A8H8WQM5_9HYPH|nr:DUF1778 domain-containing protein [Methylobacterium indicum]BCM82613.1 hypothetical protein mvi_10740 [Methylobacterium indicum]
MAERAVRSEKLDLRLTPTAKQTLQAAAEAAHKSVSEFVLDSALREAEEKLADRRVFVLGDADWDRFVEALDAPPRALDRLQRLFREPALFERDADREP